MAAKKKANKEVVPYTQMTPVHVVRQYVYQSTIIYVEINFDIGKVSLVEIVEMGKNGTTYAAKKWVFANRELEYMGGWHQILDAMKFAVDEATKELEAYNAMINARDCF